MNQFEAKPPDFFVSRAGAHPADVAMAARIGKILVDAGHEVVLQQWDFANRNFMERMNTALASGARVIAILTPQYLDSDYCEAEWQHALHDDPLNRQGRLIVLRCAPCEPAGLLRNIAFWDLLEIEGDDRMLVEIVNDAVKPDAERRGSGSAAAAWREPRPIVHHSIRHTSSFTGREDELAAIDQALQSPDTDAAVITQPAAVTGLGGIGKSTLAREYAWQNRDNYTGVWWLSAERATDGAGWPGVVDGLVALGDNYINGLAQARDRPRAAAHAFAFLARGGFDKPWLLVFDNVDDARILQHWQPDGQVKMLFTSRLTGWGPAVAPVEVRQWPMPEAIDYLLSEAGPAELTEADAKAVAEDLGCLPLALSHAAAYLRDNRTATVQSYRDAIAVHLSEVPPGVDYGRAVYATFMEQAAQAEARAPGAKALLTLAAFYAPDEIPEELFTQGPQLYPAGLANIVADRLQLEKALGALDKLSLIEFKPDTRTFTVHRLVQTAARDALGSDEPEWALSAGAAIHAAFPAPTFETWSQCERLVPHVRSIVTHIPLEERTSQLGWLLGTVGIYLADRTSLNDVLPFYQAAHDIFKRLVEADPGNAGWQRDLSVSQIKIGEVLSAQGNLTDALDAYKAPMETAKRLAEADPGNAGWQRDLSVSQEKIGDVLSAQGNLTDALDAYKASLEIRKRLAEADPGNAGWQRDLSVSQEKIGNVLSAQGNLTDALDAYKASLEIAERLAEADPGNAGWQRDLSVSQDNIGDVLGAQGNLTDALDAYKASFETAKRLAEADPGNAGWQRDLSVSQIKIGDVLSAQGNLTDALDAYKASLEIAERLAEADPGNAGWQRDLTVSQNKIGDVLRAQGNLTDALDAYKASLETAKRLADADPGNAGWQRDLSVSQEKFGDVLSAQGNLTDALDAFKASLEIRKRLAEADPGNAGWQRDLSVSQIKIGDVLRAEGNLTDALDAFKASLQIAKRLAEADPGNAEWQRDLALSHGRVSVIEAQQGEGERAIAGLRRGREIIVRLQELSPDNATLPDDLDRFDAQIASLEEE